MRFEHYLKKLYESEEYKKFRRKYKAEYLCAGFFVLDFETEKNLHQIDYMLPDRKVATFFLDEGVKIKISEQAIKKKLPKIKSEVKTDVEALKGIVEDEMKNRTVTGNIRKIIAILHILDDKLVWNLQCILDGLNILHIHVDDSDQSVLKFEKYSLMDLIKPMAGSLQIMPQKAGEIEEVKESKTKEESKEKEEVKEINAEDLEKLKEMLKAGKGEEKKERGVKGKVEKAVKEAKKEKVKKKK